MKVASTVGGGRPPLAWLFTLTTLMGLSTSGPVVASTVVPMPLQSLADFSAQVIVGKVSAVRSYWAANPRRIESEVTLTEVRFLKGAHPGAGETFRLIVPGGEVDTTRMRLACAPEFKVGERRVLFLLPTYLTFPTVGIDQGAFEIVADAQGVDRVYQQGGYPVVGFDIDGFALLGGGHDADAHDHLIEAHHAIIRSAETPVPEAAQTSRTAQPNEEASHKATNSPLIAMSLSDFLAKIQPVLDASINHHMNEPAGRRILVAYRAVTLKNAIAGAASTVSDGKKNAPSTGQAGALRAEPPHEAAADTGHGSRGEPSVDAPKATGGGGGTP